MLTANEYVLRRSRSLQNKWATLEEKHEIWCYLGTQDINYLARLIQLSDLSKPMQQSCRMVITVSAYNESTRIRHSLTQYAKQQVDPTLFEIVVVVYPTPNDTTPAEIEEFSQEYPNIVLTTCYLTPGHDEPETLGLNRKFGCDIALLRMLYRGTVDQDTIIIINDADIRGLADNYLSSILNKLDNNPQIDALTTEVRIPELAMQKPNVSAALRLHNAFEKNFAKDEPALIGSTAGTSGAVRASMYAAVGGFNPLAVIGESWELSWLIADARGWQRNRVIYFDQTFLVGDPRRILDSILHRIPIDQGLVGYQENIAVRELDNNAILALIPDKLDWELFQDDVDSLWRSQRTGSNNRIAREQFVNLFKQTMDELGITYELDDSGGIRLLNVHGLGPRDIIHSSPRSYTPELIQQISNTFATFTQGCIEARQRHFKGQQ